MNRTLMVDGKLNSEQVGEYKKDTFETHFFILMWLFISRAIIVQESNQGLTFS